MIGDRVNEVYYRLVSDSETQEILRDRIHWICREAKGARILDIGCSQGITSLLLAREGKQVTAIDYNKAAIEYAQAELQKELPAVQKRVTLVSSDIYSLQDDLGTFDTIILGEIIEHQAQPERLLQKACLFLKQGGTVLITTPFGIRPDVDHKKTFVMSSFVALVAKHFSKQTLFIKNRYIFFAGSLKKQNKIIAFPRQEILEQTEQGLLFSENRFYGIVDRLRAEIKSLKTAAIELQRTIRQEKERFEKFEQKFIDQQVKYTGLQARLVTEKGSLAELRETIKNDTAKIAKLQAGLEAETGTVAELRATIKDNAAKYAGLQDRLDAETGTAAELRKTIRDSAADLAALKDRLNAETATVAELRKTIRDSTADLAALKDRLNAETATVAQLRKTIQDGEIQKTILHERLKAKQDTISELREAVENHKKVESRLYPEANRVSKLQKELDEYRTKQAEARARMESLVEDQSGLQKSMEAEQEAYRELKNTLKTVRQERDAYLIQSDTASRNLAEARKETIFLGQRIKMTEQHGQMLQADLEQMTAARNQAARNYYEVTQSLSYKALLSIMQAFSRPGRHTLLLPVTLARLCLAKAGKSLSGKRTTRPAGTQRKPEQKKKYAVPPAAEKTRQEMGIVPSGPGILKTRDEYVQALHRFLEHIKNSNAGHFMLMFSGTTFIQDIRANRPIRLTKCLIDMGIPVFFNYHRWRKTDPVPAYDNPLLFQSPIDLTLQHAKDLYQADFGSTTATCIVSYPYPEFVKNLNLFNSRGWATIYDCRDDWEEFHKVGAAKWYVGAVEKFVVHNCDATCCVSWPLQKKMQAYTDPLKVHLLPNAYDPGFLTPGYKHEPAAETVIGYFGHLNQSWFSWWSMIRIAEKRPDFRFEIIGHSEPRELETPLPANIVLLGPRTHPEICDIARRWRAAIIPFKTGKLADGVDPIKIYEYFALGLPVVSFRMPQIDSYPYTTTVNNVDQFVAALDRAVKITCDPRVLRDFLENNTWMHRADWFVKTAGQIKTRRCVEKSFDALNTTETK